MIKRMMIKFLSSLGYRANKNPCVHSIEKLIEIIGFEIDYNNNPFLSEALDLLEQLKKNGARFAQNGNRLIVAVDQVKYKIHSWEELFILHELFVEKVYDIELPPKFSLIDIGMNVGITSLYFASKQACETIFAYEPFHKTIEKAKENFEMNPASNKIHVFEFGLGYPERSVTVFYSEKLKGSVGIYEDALANQSEDKMPEGLDIRDAGKYLQKNFEDHPGVFIAKIDCEGAEYEIIKRLDETRLLRNISSYIIEWHGKGAEELSDIFVKNEYEVCERSSEQTYRGIIYCKKKN